MSKKIILYLVILMVIVFTVGCTFMDGLLFPTSTPSGSPRATLTFADGEPTYIGQDFTVKVNLSPKRTVNYIKVVMVDLINNRETVMQQDYSYEAVFKFKVNSSKFRFYVETPYQNKSRGNEIYYPSKEFWYEFTDYTPPTVNYSFERVSSSGNEYKLLIDAVDEQSGVKEIYLEVDGRRESVALRSDARQTEKRITLSIGYHSVVVYARNEKGLVGFNEQTIEVTPPVSSAPPVIDLNMQSNIHVYKGETVYLNANVYDHTSYLKTVELLSSKGWLKQIPFDPVQESYYLNYPVKVESDETINIKARNSNDIIADRDINITVDTHKVPETTLSATPNAERFEKSTEIELSFDTKAFDGEKIDMVYVLVNNSTFRTFDVNETETYSGSVKYSLKNGENTFSVVAVDTKGARGTSNLITITGFKVDREPPSIMLLFPDVAYMGVEAELPFLAEDYDSGLEGLPTLSIVDTGASTPVSLNSLSGYYFTGRWTPKEIKTYSFLVTAADKAGNTSRAEKTITVKDPTGILWPTVGSLAAAPSRSNLGDKVNLTLSVVPPQSMEQSEINVSFEVGLNGTNTESLGNVVNTGNLYTVQYEPLAEGVYAANANVYWGDDNVSRTTSFTVVSPEPTMTFSVEPSKTYTGGNVVLSLITDTSNPFASVSVIEMTVDFIPLTWTVIETEDQKIYRATKSTIDLPTGQHIARAKIRDNFENETITEKMFYTESPELIIKSVNMTPKTGQIFRVYNPVDFEVYLEKTLPPEIVPNGEVEITPPMGNSRTIQLNQATGNVYKYQSETSWIPDQEGTFTVDVRFNALIGTEMLSTSTTREVGILEQDIVIDITASPMSIDNITVGREVDLVFEINGIMEDDSVQSIKYALYQGTSLILGPSIPDMIETNRYSSNISFFSETGDYEVVATVTTLASERSTSRPFTVAESEISKVSFALDGLQENLFYGSPMNFKLELDNPDALSNLRVTMFLVDASKTKIEQLNTISATAMDNSYSIFENSEPFQLYREGVFYAAASVTLSQIPAIHLPIMYSDTYYEMPGPNLRIEYDESKDYYGGYTGSLDLTITKPSSMVLQTPILEKISGVDNLVLTPYASPSNPYDTQLEYKFYVKPVDTSVANTFTIKTTLYDAEDVSNTSPVLEPTETTFAIQDYDPEVKIRMMNGKAENVNKCKNPQIEFRVDDLPEFFVGRFNFYTTLNGLVSTVGANISSTETATVLTFNANSYSGVDVGSTVTAFAEITGFNDRPGENFTATGTRDFTVSVPGIGRIDIIADQQMPIYAENDVLVEFTTLEDVDSNMIVVFETSNRTEAYPGVRPIVANGLGRATITGVVFNTAGTYTATATIYCNNSTPDIQLGLPETTTLRTYNSEPKVLVKYPSQTDKIFYHQNIRPIIHCLSIPGVTDVDVAIIDELSNVVTLIMEKNGDEWVLASSEPDYKINSVGQYTINATAISSVVGSVSGSNTFTAVAGNFSNLTLSRMTGGDLIFSGEELKFQSEVFFDNPNAEPIVQSVATNTTTNQPVFFTLDSTNVVPGDPKSFVHVWKSNDQTGAIPVGDCEIAINVSFFDASNTVSNTFEIVPNIDQASPILTPSSGNVGELFTAYISFTVPPRIIQKCVTENSTLSDFITGNIVLENCGQQPITIESTPAGGGAYEYTITRKGVAQEPETSGQTFNAIFNASIDQVQVVSERKPFTIIP